MFQKFSSFILVSLLAPVAAVASSVTISGQSVYVTPQCNDYDVYPNGGQTEMELYNKYGRDEGMSPEVYLGADQNKDNPACDAAIAQYNEKNPTQIIDDKTVITSIAGSADAAQISRSAPDGRHCDWGLFSDYKLGYRVYHCTMTVSFDTPTQK
jgi:hypothetical protein